MTYLSEQLDLEVPDGVCARFTVQEKHEEPASHVTEQIAAAIAVHLAEARDRALLLTPQQQRSTCLLRSSSSAL